jgi:uncharacterized membrane protein
MTTALIIIDCLLIVAVVLLLRYAIKLVRTGVQRDLRQACGHVERITDDRGPWCGKDQANDFMTGRPKQRRPYVAGAK